MKIIGATQIVGLPGDQRVKVINYPATGTTSHREGVVVSFQSEDGVEWIGNFVDDNQGTSLKPSVKEFSEDVH